MDFRLKIGKYDDVNYPDSWIGRGVYNSKTMELISIQVVQKDQNSEEYNEIKEAYESYNFYDSENQTWNTYALGAHPYIVIDELMASISEYAAREAAANKSREFLELFGEQEYDKIYKDYCERMLIDYDYWNRCGQRD